MARSDLAAESLFELIAGPEPAGLVPEENPRLDDLPDGFDLLFIDLVHEI